MNEDSENVAEDSEDAADLEGWENDESDSGESSEIDLSELSALVDANGQKIENLSVTLDEVDSKVTKSGEELHELRESQEIDSSVDEVYSDIATLASYQTLLLVVIAAFVALDIGVRISSFFFSYLKDK